MRIGLLDIDGHNFPNYALMKIAAYHKAIGDSVEWANHFYSYDKVYQSKVFTFSPDDDTYIDAKEIIRGGTGYDIKARLPQEIEDFNQLDYSIYPQYKFSIQFFSRGCIRNCDFCLVREKEGYISSAEPTNLNPNGKWIEVLDNNFFANPEWRNAIDFLNSTNLPVKLHGVDVRIMDEGQASALNSLKLQQNIHIAWDSPKIDLKSRLGEVLKYVKPYKLCCYVLVGFNSTIEQDLYRLRTLKELKIQPFVQPYRDVNNTRVPAQYEKDLARWANKMWLFKAFDFKDFSPRKGFRCSEYLNNVAT